MGKGEESDVYFDDGFFPEAFHPFFITFIAALVARHDVNLRLDGGEMCIRDSCWPFHKEPRLGYSPG